MLCPNPGLSVLNDDHWSTDPPTITGNMNCLLVVVDVHTNEFINLPRPPQFSKIINKASRIAGDANDRAVDVNNEGPE